MHDITPEERRAMFARWVQIAVGLRSNVPRGQMPEYARCAVADAIMVACLIEACTHLLSPAARKMVFVDANRRARAMQQELFESDAKAGATTDDVDALIRDVLRRPPGQRP